MMLQDLMSALGRSLWETSLVPEYAAASGEKPEVKDVIDETYCLFRRAGFSVVLSQDDGAIQVIHIYNREPGYAPFAAPLPRGLRLEMTRVEVEKLLGAPSKSGGGGRNPITGGIIPEWVRYDGLPEFVHVEFGRDDKGRQFVAKVTLMTAKRAERLK